MSLKFSLYPTCSTALLTNSCQPTYSLSESSVDSLRSILSLCLPSILRLLPASAFVCVVWLSLYSQIDALSTMAVQIFLSELPFFYKQMRYFYFQNAMTNFGHLHLP